MVVVVVGVKGNTRVVVWRVGVRIRVRVVGGEWCKWLGWDESVGGVVVVG